MELYSIEAILFSVCLYLNGVASVHLRAYISQHGLHGEFHFVQRYDNSVEIRSNLETTLQYPDQIWSWGIHKMPVDYSEIDGYRRCHLSKIGAKVIDFDRHLGYLEMPGNESVEWILSSEEIGGQSIWGKSLVLQNPNDDFRVCGTITTREEDMNHVAEAIFHAPIAGSIYFRWLSAKDKHHQNILITSNLFHTKNISTSNRLSNHPWKIFVTDIFENDPDKTQTDCNKLQLIYDPQNAGSGKSIGDIDLRVGEIKVAGYNQGSFASNQLFEDDNLILLPSDLSGSRRHLYVVIYDHIHKNQFLSCAKVRNVRSRIAKSIFNAKGVTGEIVFQQRSLFEPTWLNFTVNSAKNELKENTAYLSRLAGFQIRSLPADPTRFGASDFCDTMGQIYNPLNIEDNDLPPAGYGTQDQYPVGDLSGKLQSRNVDYPHNYLLPLNPGNELNGVYWDVFLPTKGSNSIINRGVAIEEYNRTVVQTTRSIWTCGTISLYQENRRYQMQMITAQVHFRYPIVGRILFRQPMSNSFDDTSILIEYLIHADGSSVDTTDRHRWAIHAEPPGKDFYNWTGRCLSAGQIYNPYHVDFDPKHPAKTCSSENRVACPLGGLGNRFETISIAGSKKFRSISRKLFTDQFLSLSGYNSILGKSLVIYDDFGPMARGERLACSIIELQVPRKVLANDWFGNGVPVSVKGKIEFTQQSEYEVTNIDVQLKGLMENSGYHVHIAPVQGELEFPCERSTLYDHWNPQNVDPKSVPSPKEASTDLYEMGDLSGKFGNLDHLNGLMASYNDTNIPIFGYDTILGRSIVIHKKEKNIRWACSSLARGYSLRESREIRAIASFHHPNGFTYGYIRFTQLIHSDGSKSDTSIEVNLKYPGQNDRNKTIGHHWNIFVNPVGVDAIVHQTLSRCVAGGYVWNPYYTQLADPLNTKLYNEECGPDNPLRCYVGDVSSRLGPIDIGMKRQIFSDKNIPLEGHQGAIGRSVVIFGPNQSLERFSCANIEPDHNIVKYVNLQRPPKFIVAQFLEEVRTILGIPEWMLGIDSRKTTILHNGGCIQMLIHFKGPLAHQMELDLSRLIASGRLEAPTLNIFGYSNQKRKKTLSYRTCGSRDPNDESVKKRRYGSRIFNGCKSTNSSIQLFYIFIVYPLFINYFLE